MSTTTNHLRIVHTSDWQLGMAPHFLGEEARPRYSYDRLVAVENLLALATERQCDAVVVAGDVFDNNFLKPEVYQRALDVLSATKVPVYLLPGNHDPYDAASIYRKDGIQKLSNVHVLTDSEPVEIKPGARVVGAPMRSKHVNVDLVAEAIQTLEPPQDSTVTVLVGHGAAVAFGAAQPEHIDVTGAEDAYRCRKLDYVALGDTHSTTELGSEGMVWYSGSPEVTDYKEPEGGGESNSGNVLIVDIDVQDAQTPAQVRVEEVHVGAWSFQALAAEVNSREDAERFVDEVLALTDKARTSVKYALSGAVDLETHAWLERQLEEIAPKFAALYRRDRLWSLFVRPSADELSGDALGQGLVKAVVDQLSEMIEQGDETASDALNLLFRLKQEQEA